MVQTAFVLDRMFFLVLPIIPMLILPFFRSIQLTRWFVLAFTTVIFLFSIYIFCPSVDSLAHYDLQRAAVGGNGLIDSLFLKYFSFGSISGAFVILTAFITPISILAGWRYVHYKAFIYIMLILELLLFLAFTLTNLFGFFISFEAILIPMFLLIGV